MARHKLTDEHTVLFFNKSKEEPILIAQDVPDKLCASFGGFEHDAEICIHCTSATRRSLVVSRSIAVTIKQKNGKIAIWGPSEVETRTWILDIVSFQTSIHASCACKARQMQNRQRMEVYVLNQIFRYARNMKTRGAKSTVSQACQDIKPEEIRKCKTKLSALTHCDSYRNSYRNI